MAWKTSWLHRFAPLLLLPLAINAIAQQAPQSLARDAALVNRVTWGATPAELERARNMGIDHYLREQLRPARQDNLPAEIQRRIDALSISQQSDDAARAIQITLRQQSRKLPEDEKFAANRKAHQMSLARAAEVNERAVLRALYTPHQLQDQMTWFWMNHFNVDFQKGDVGIFLSQYEDNAIRPHALGKFRDLLAATMRSPSMLIYLDNTQNMAGKINENYARELMELHTLGAGGGYSQNDVQELARILTGLGISNSLEPPKIKRELLAQVVQQGYFLFNPARHDYGSKVFLGHAIAGAGMQEVEQAADLLARNPATAKFISKKLAAYFAGEAPPASLVDKMSRTFLEKDGDISATLQTLFGSPEFAASLKTGVFKDPVHYFYSSMRMTYNGLPPIINAKVGVNLLKRLGQPLNQHLTPDGYPLSQSDWSGSGQMTVRFEIANAIASSPQSFYRNSPDDRPANVPRPPNLLAANDGNGLFSMMSTRTRDAIEQAKSIPIANTYLLASPEFMRR
ncbi:DUF1800 domain-containing protein [Achromobacter pestifer]|uniref:DUF1800 domain-containing protein n=1 Tax=Achromobacter pestifer TaxID=1353889 RepID=A0A6S6YKR5_9BURK|nr:DUF1800 domain-containing protein [Achromobacter pestifer]CAB3630316.1 hypothetical protein LMG3431_01026 [Achromobacter pestifer]